MRQLAEAGGAIRLDRNYDPFGNLEAEAGSGSSMFGFTGEQTLSTGMMYLRAREYGPYLNQFIQPDTIVPDPRIPADWNKHTYARDNPINYTDPSGRFSIHFEVEIRYATEYDLIPEYVIPSTVPSTPPLWPGQRRGKRVDLADMLNFEIWEIEPYSESGNYPSGHGVSQVYDYLTLLNSAHNGSGTAFVNQWEPGRYLSPLNFTSGPYDVTAWWEQPGLIVYQQQLNPEKVTEAAAIICMVGLAKLIKSIQDEQQKLRELPGQFPPLPMPSPFTPHAPGGVPILPYPIVPLPIP